MSDITLSAGIRANLLSLQQTSDLMTLTQNRLATGKKVNSALDNPLNYFQSSSLSARANDLSGLLDTMASGISTIQAANNGITAITSLVQQLKATVQQARSDATSGTVAATPTASGTYTSITGSGANDKITFDVGGGQTISVNTNVQSAAVASTLTSSTTANYGADESTAGTLTINDGSVTTNVTFAAGDNTLSKKIVAINAALGSAGSTVTAQADSNGKLELVNSTGKQITVNNTGGGATVAADLGFTVGTNNTSSNGAVANNTPLSWSALAAAVNNNALLSGKVSATVHQTAGVDDGIIFNNLSNTGAVTISGVSGAAIDGNAAHTVSVAAAAGGTISNVRQSLMNQFNDLLTQIDKAAGDAGYNGINLLSGDQLKLNFNENGSSNITIQSKDANGNKFVLTSQNLGFNAGTTSQFADNSQLDSLSTTIATALTTLRTQASSLGSSLSVVQTRQDFTKSMVNTLQTGADNLVLADTNEEGANLLALQTRQSLSTTALSLSAQADQNVLRLFG
jgi:flagellin-like hook-associated protein FlgL